MSDKPILSIRDLRYAYKKDHALINIDHFEINKGQQISIQGESGSGKSTLLNLCTGILPIQSGQVEIEGHSLEKLSEAKRDLFRAAHIGYIHQQFLLLANYTAIENLLIPMALKNQHDEKRAKEMLGELGIEKHADKKPGEMSIGERQRLATARALINSPAIIFADEPTASLDEENSRNSIQLIKQLCRDKSITLVLVTHSNEIWSSFEERMTWKEINQA